MSSIYCTQDDLELVFGTNSIDAWADLDGNATKKASRITEAIAQAGEEIDAVLRTTVYSNQLPIADSGAATPRMIKNIAAVLAAVWLYDAQGCRDRDKDGRPFHNLEFKRQWALEKLEQIRSNQIKLDAVN